MKRRTLLIVAGILVAQVVAVGVYTAVESERDAVELSTALPRPAAGSITSFPVTMRDGSTRELVGERPVLVHFWGTWCPPCLDELPLVLALPEGLPFDVVAVALDDDWRAVDEFIEDHDPARVARADRKLAEQKFELSSLPQTVLMAPDGQLVLRVNGARDWTDEAFVESWRVD